MSLEGQYDFIREAMRALPMVEAIAGRSYPALNWQAAKAAVRTSLTIRTK